MALYIGANYHPHDWTPERWRIDIDLMKQAGFDTVRVGHLAWDSFEPDDGVYTFEWFDEVMDLFAAAGIKVLLDVSMRPAPQWVHKLCPGCNITSKSGHEMRSVRRYMEDVADPAYRQYALRFAEMLVKRYASHPALFAFGLCNEQGSGPMSFSEMSRQRFVQWLKKKYKTIDALNAAWQTQRWCRRLTSFDDVFFPVTETVTGAPEPCLDMRRFFSDGIGGFLALLKDTVARLAPDVPTSCNHYAEQETLGFDYLRWYPHFVDYPGMGFYPGFQITERYHFMQGNSAFRVAETDKPLWSIEYQAGGQGFHHGPYGALYMNAMLSLLNRTQMILGWTWRSMLGGEEQYLVGLLDHDGRPNVNYREDAEIARDIRKLEPYAFPYLPVPEIAVAYSFDSDMVAYYGKYQYHHSRRANSAAINELFFNLNLDYNVVNLTARKHDYKLLILPEYLLVSPEEAKAVRDYIAAGGTVVMTGHSGTVDEHNRVFAEPLPGRLSDVFGVRVAGFERTGAMWKDFAPDAEIVEDANGKRERLRVAPVAEACAGVGANDNAAPFLLDVEYYEQLELTGARALADFADKGSAAVTVHQYGKGSAYYVAAETNVTLLTWLLSRLLPALGIRRPLQVPVGIQARELAPGQRFYVNTTNRAVTVPLETGGRGVLSGKPLAAVLELSPYSAELVVAE